jgi:lipopolysaccharide transport system ATP-binding protein
VQVEEFWALKNVNVQIQPGEVVGVVGRNGAGKSTFLKTLARVTMPTTGRIRLMGRVGSLLEVGTGFHPELTGRENVYLNGAILGMSRKEIAERFDAIVEFAEIAQFLDTPVKRYSSGMYVRLAFAVAAHLEPEILLVDEVLAVGDAAFQRKCLGKMGEVARGGRTILFVSHNMAAVTRLCGRALWFDEGTLRDDGDSESVVAKYLAAGAAQGGEITYGDKNGRKGPGSDYVTLEAVRLRSDAGNVSPIVDVRLPFLVEVQYRVLCPSNGLRVGIRLTAHDGTVLLSTTDRDDENELGREPGVYVSRCKIPGDFLNYGLYYVSVGCDFPMAQTHFLIDQALAFQIEQTGGVGGHISDGRSGMVRVRLPWNVERIGS